ncbi:preprotein translocase subunit Sec61beta [Candidatus Bathyarchaeota archaeon]|jgi:preprotein translocase subunit Sec61beta|nr:preprotein translocase subunit Sec61beta [Candidatus Bathyarchaeota archaeon]
MSGKRKKKREKKAPMPMQSAGLLRFFEEETRGVKVKPEMVIIFTVALTVFCILLRLGIIPGFPA